MNLSEVERKKNLNLNCSIRTWMPFNVIFWLKLGFLREFSEGISVEWQIAPGEVQIYWTGKCWMVLAVKVLSCYQEINKCGIRIINLVRIRVGGRDTNMHKQSSNGHDIWFIELQLVNIRVLYLTKAKRIFKLCQWEVLILSRFHFLSHGVISLLIWPWEHVCFWILLCWYVLVQLFFGFDCTSDNKGLTI